MHRGIPLPAASIKPLISDCVVFEMSQKVSKNGQKIKTLTLLKARKFWLKILDVSAYTSELHATLFLIESKISDLGWYFSRQVKKLQKTVKSFVFPRVQF